jgi:hypothetical protein
VTGPDVVVCEFCGDEYKKQGLAAHQRFCDEKPDEGDEDSDGENGGVGEDERPVEAEEGDVPADEGEVSGDTPTPRDNLDPIEQAAIDRDDGTCLHCGATDGLVVHVVDEDERERLANLFTLCDDCLPEFEDLHPLTKRTKIFH